MENSRVGSRSRNAAIGAILDQWKMDQKEGKEPSIEEYLKRYPEYAKELREELEGHELVCALFAILERESRFTEEEAKACLERSKEYIRQERAKMAKNKD